MDVSRMAWVASIPGVGPRTFEKYREYFCDPTFLSPRERVSSSYRIPAKLIDSIQRHLRIHTPDEIARYCEKNAITILTQADAAYPSLLKEISDAPIVLYVKGKLPLSSMPKIAVVGTRKITAYGEEVTQSFVRELVQKGFVIVSGFMFGVDACAHRTALECGGQTIGVLGFGFEHMYPATHHRLADEMIHSGNCLVTEFPPWQTPTGSTFPLRNRIVSGMSVGVLVTEAASKSGSKITARLAAEQGRSVFAVPGSVFSQFSDGTKELVNIGATLVTSAQDIMDELSTGSWNLET